MVRAPVILPEILGRLAGLGGALRSGGEGRSGWVGTSVGNGSAKGSGRISNAGWEEGEWCEGEAGYSQIRALLRVHHGSNGDTEVRNRTPEICPR